MILVSTGNSSLVQDLNNYVGIKSSSHNLFRDFWMIRLISCSDMGENSIIPESKDGRDSSEVWEMLVVAICVFISLLICAILFMKKNH